MGAEPAQLAIGALLAAVVSVTAFQFRALTISGALAAFVVGTVVFGAGGIPYSVPLLVFFISSSVLSHLTNHRKQTAMRFAAKTHARDAWQVLANGGVATAIVVASVVLPPGATPSSRDWSLLYLSALAAVNADTWATEIGTLLAAAPRAITSWRPVPPGSSGAVSLPGTLAGLLGAAVVVLSAVAVWPARSEYLLWRPDAAEALAVIWAGLVGMLCDSILGASVQAQFECSACGRVSEDRHHCGKRGVRRSGYSWVTNDTVNAAASVAAVLCAWFLLTRFAWPTR